MAGADNNLGDAVTAADAALERCRSMEAAGQWRAALGNARQAVLLYRQLASHDPALYCPDLALALDREADMAAAIGRHDDALASARESVALFRELADLAASNTAPAGEAHAGDDRNPAGDEIEEALLFRPYLGAALCGLAGRLHETGDDVAALTTVREGIHLFDNADADVLRQHRTALEAARRLRNVLSPDEHLLDEEFGSVFADAPEV